VVPATERKILQTKNLHFAYSFSKRAIFQSGVILTMSNDSAPRS